MKKFISVFVVLVIAVTLFMYARVLHMKYELAYSDGVLDGMCYMTNRFDLDTEGACKGRSEEPGVHYSYNDR